MLFSHALILAVLPFLAQAAPFETRANGGQGNKGGNANANQGGNNGGAAAAAAAGAGAAGAAAAGAANATAAAAGGDIQSSLTLDPSVIATGFANDGQDVPAAGQVASITSTNNFINFCAGQTITNGKQIVGGSCNPAPMGQIAAQTVMPSSKFVFPPNGDTSLQANTEFTIQMAISNLQTGNFVNAEENYFAAPQQVNAQGQIIGHSHVVIEQLQAIDQTTPTDPTKFAFFKGLNDPAANGVLTADVTAGLPAGVYKLSSINSAANHQPALVAVAQHGSLDDAVYFTVGGAGAGAGAAAGAAGAANATAAAGAAGNNAGAGAAAAGKGQGAQGAAAQGKGAAAAQGKGQGKGRFARFRL